MVFVPMAQAPPKAGAKDLLYSQSKFDPWVYILVFAEGNFCRFAWESLPTEAGVCRHQCFSVVAQATAKIRPRPKGYFQLKELYRTTKAYSQMNADWKVGKAQYAEINVPTCGKIAVWQLCRETQPLWNSHDSWWPELKTFGSMPWCSFPWHKLLPRLAQKTCCTVSLNLIHEFTSLFLPKVIFAGLPGKAFPRKQAFVDISVFLWLRKQRPRFAQGPRVIFNWKNFIEQLKHILKWMLIERWGRPSMLSSMCQHVPGLTLRCGPC